MSRFIVVAALLAAAWGLLAVSEAQAGLKEEYIAKAAQLDQEAAKLERLGGSTNLQAAKVFRQYAAQYRAEAAKLGGSSSGGSSGGGLTVTRPDPYSAANMQARSNSARDQALAFVQKNSRYKYFIIYYRQAPIYQGQDFGTKVYSWKCQAYEAVRTINSLANNRKLIVSMTATNS